MAVIPLKPRNKKGAQPNRNPGLVVGSSKTLSAKPDGVAAEDLYDFDLAGALRVSDEVAANGGAQDVMVFQGETERAVRRLVAEFGFPRLPLTVAEFHGFVEYCQMLDTASGTSMLAENEAERKAWQSVSIAKYCGFFPQHADAIRLYCAGNREALSHLHKQNRTLETLAKNYAEFGNEPV